MRLGPLFLLALAGLSACGGSAPSNTRAQIEDAIDQHLARRSDLDIDSMKVTVGQIEFQGDDRARATVAFQVGDSPESSMQMVYDLKRDNGAWEVLRNENAGHGAGQVAPPATNPGSNPNLPANHPPVGGQQQAQPKLPAGHPPVQ